MIARVVLTGAFISVLGVGVVRTRAGGIEPGYAKDVERWRATHEADYRREYVALAGLFFLKAGVNTAGSAPTNDVVLPKSTPASVGRFVLTGDRVRFEPQSGVVLSLKGRGVLNPIELTSDDGNDGADELEIAGVSMWVHRSGDRRGIRVRDEHGEIAQSFAGFRWFPIDARYRVIGRFVKDSAPHEVSLPNLTGDADTYTTEGVVTFTLNGAMIRLRPMTTRPGRLFFIFRDATSGHETYGAARFLYADLKADGTTVLDFNEAYNPPCAFNPFTTCPRPPAENRLRVRITAGERAYARGTHRLAPPARSGTGE